ncbi:hypothetical protein SEA_DUSTYDINO_117 [Microbacterium phage DustyDino]|nr:hypothetical protein SEA_DUSTYDINO_117 [Microbacterium phage DustyDino]UVK62527.1 hypothetical protein SEA_YUMA_112 [Microbacterium phage Yuma]
MSDRMNKWNPTMFKTARGTFYGLTWWLDGQMRLRSRSLRDREIGDGVILHSSVYVIDDMRKSGSGDPIAILVLPHDNECEAGEPDYATTACRCADRRGGK